MTELEGPAHQPEAPAPAVQGRESLFSTRNVAAITIGTGLFAVLAIPFNIFTFPSFSLVSARPAVAIPIVFGFVFGPVAGFFSGFLGGVISDQISFGSLFWNWDLGYGLIGLISAVGYYAIKRSSLARPTGLAASSILAVVGSAVGAGFSALTDVFLQTSINPVAIAVAELVPNAVTDVVNGAILGPILIYAYVRSTSRRTRPP